MTTARKFGFECLNVADNVYSLEFEGALEEKLSRLWTEALVAEGQAWGFASAMATR